MVEVSQPVRSVSNSRGLKVIARFRDGRLLKGVSMNFRRDAAYFHIEEPEKVYGEGVRVDLKDLKAVFFVKSLDGKPGYKERIGFDRAPASGRPVRIVFVDGEEMFGVLQQVIDRKQRGFFVFPADAEGNNEHVFALHDAVANVEDIAEGSPGWPASKPA